MTIYNNPEKRIYSLNLLAFLEMKTGTNADLHREGNLVYGTFDDSPAVSAAVREYRDSNCEVNLHEFLTAFKELRSRINEMRREG